jgi:hypothetical protein
MTSRAVDVKRRRHSEPWRTRHRCVDAAFDHDELAHLVQFRDLGFRIGDLNTFTTHAVARVD